MKSKKGFTLIEVLAIIIILAIIAVITVPIVLDVIDNSKIGAAKDSAYGYINSVNKLYVSKSMSNPDYEVPDSYYKVSDLKTMGVSVSGDEPSGNSWVRVVDNEVVSGCLQFGEYSVNITNGVVGNVIKGDCESVTPFELDSWDAIKSAVNADNIDFYNVGDTKEVLIGGVSYTFRLANKTFDGCDTEENGFSQTACGFVIEFVDTVGRKVLNSPSSNVGGWPATVIYSYLNVDDDSIYNKLPSDLKNVIADTYTVSGHGRTAGETNFSSISKLYLLSSQEVFGNNQEYDTANSSTKQLEYYQDNNTSSDRIKYTSAGVESIWWLRSPRSIYTDDFYCVESDGSIAPRNASYSYGVAPAFRIVKD